MISPATALSFFLASIVITLSPGPDILFVLAQSLAGGPRRGLLVAAGLCSGFVVHTMLVASGLAAVLAASPVAFGVLKIIGACYLLYLAWCAFREPVHAQKAEASALRGARLYRRGIIMNLTNPKLIVFILAFWPQFTEPARGRVWFQLVELGGLAIVASYLVFAAVSIAAGSIGKKLLQSPAAQRALSYVSGAIFTVLALWLLLSGAGAHFHV